MAATYNPPDVQYFEKLLEIENLILLEALDVDTFLINVKVSDEYYESFRILHLRQ